MEEARQDFENQWKDQFEDAEMAPPPSVWVAIDGQLSKNELTGYKRKIVLYKWVAAASLLIAALSSVFYLNNDIKSEKLPVAVTEDFSNKSGVVDKDSSTDDDNSGIFDKQVFESTELNTESNEKKTYRNSKALPRLVGLATEEQESFDDDGANGLQKSTIDGVLINKLMAKQLSFESATKIEELDELYGVPVMTASEMLAEDYDKLWAGVSFSAGSFDPGFQNGNENMDFVPEVSEFGPNNRTEEIPSFSPGSSIAAGINLGKRMGKRLVLSSGLHYSAFSTGSAESRIYLDDNSNEFAVAYKRQDQFAEQAEGESVDNRSFASTTISVNNEFQYLTIPLKAGIIMVDRKLNIVLNTGISSNILMNANLASNDVNATLDESSNYQSMYFNWLSSVELGYRLLDRYQLSLEPAYNIAINEFTNTNHSSNGRPTNFGMTVGFRYNF